MDEAWYWWTVAVLTGLGTVLFTVSSRRYHARGRESMTGFDVGIGLFSLALLAWGVLLAGAGGAWWLGVTIFGRCVP